jgi:hypothetical protein
VRRAGGPEGSGSRASRLIAFFRNRIVTLLSWCFVSRKSMVWPCLSTTRYRYRHAPCRSPGENTRKDGTCAAWHAVRPHRCEWRRTYVALCVGCASRAVGWDVVPGPVIPHQRDGGDV